MIKHVSCNTKSLSGTRNSSDTMFYTFRKFARLLKRWRGAKSQTSSAGGHGSSGESQRTHKQTFIHSHRLNLFVSVCRLQLEWHILKGWTTSTETCEQPTSLSETIWCARSLTLAWLGSLRTMSTQHDKVPHCDYLEYLPLWMYFYIFIFIHYTSCPNCTSIRVHLLPWFQGQSFPLSGRLQKLRCTDVLLSSQMSGALVYF